MNSFNDLTFYFVIQMYFLFPSRRKSNSAVTTVKSDKFSDVTHKSARKWIVNVLTARGQEHPLGVSGPGLCNETNEIMFPLDA